MKGFIMDFLKGLKDGMVALGYQSKEDYLASNVFNLDTGGSFDDLYVKKILEVTKAISEGTTFEYIKTEENEFWFINVLNLPFFKNRYDYGVSIRGAWWEDEQPEVDLFFLFDGKNQYLETVKMNAVEWNKFLSALSSFYNEEYVPTNQKNKP